MRVGLVVTAIIFFMIGMYHNQLTKLTSWQRGWNDCAKTFLSNESARELLKDGHIVVFECESISCEFNQRLNKFRKKG